MPLFMLYAEFAYNLLVPKVLIQFYHASRKTPQEALLQRHYVYCVHVKSVGCTRTGMKLVSTDHLWCLFVLRQTPVPLQSWCSQLT
jgi:hypothetical protein